MGLPSAERRSSAVMKPSNPSVERKGPEAGSWPARSGGGQLAGRSDRERVLADVNVAQRRPTSPRMDGLGRKTVVINMFSDPTVKIRPKTVKPAARSPVAFKPCRGATGVMCWPLASPGSVDGAVVLLAAEDRCGQTTT